jgi:hypothetical protein
VWVLLEFGFELVVGVLCDEEGGGSGGVGRVGEGDCEGF